MAPTARKGGGKKRSERAQEPDDDDKFLDKENQGRWTDGFMVLRLARWIAESSMDVVRGRRQPDTSPSARKKDTPKLEPKEAAMQFLSNKNTSRPPCNLCPDLRDHRWR